MARGYEEVSSSQAGCWRVTPRETPTASSLVAAMSAKELRLYNQVLAEVSLEMLDNQATSTVGGQITPSTSLESSSPQGFASVSRCW